jgi:hypothetical protein
VAPRLTSVPASCRWRCRGQRLYFQSDYAEVPGLSSVQVHVIGAVEDSTQISNLIMLRFRYWPQFQPHVVGAVEDSAQISNLVVLRLRDWPLFQPHVVGAVEDSAQVVILQSGVMAKLPALRSFINFFHKQGKFVH